MADPLLPPLPDREPADIQLWKKAAPPSDRRAPPADAAPVEEHEVISVELLQSLVRLACNEAHEKADVFAAALDKVRARTDQLDKGSLQRILVGFLADPVRGKIAKEAAFILKLSS
ncbi:hypothetical protein OS493_010722 [Desmophyllum pertusum]|uniref:Uncharacterized protein n=1 Tax=Desmophyllum pertusum TaxID=174260 RepID=A0A9W9ZSF8_9CNID|nr:hypothetical protein OS493_010722 [Desmophyllum pertusum]